MKIYDIIQNIWEIKMSGITDVERQILLSEMKEIIKEVKNDPKKAKEWLIRAGIYLPNGEPNPNYYN